MSHKDYNKVQQYQNGYNIITFNCILKRNGKPCMGESCNTHRADEKHITNFGRKTWSEETTRKI